MRALLVIMALLASLAAAGKSLFVVKQGVIVRTSSANKVRVILTTAPAWCPSCQEFEPVFAAVSKAMAADADFLVIDADHLKLAEDPGYVPWTWIKSNDRRCEQEIAGFVSEPQLFAAVMKAVRCQEGR